MKPLLYQLFLFRLAGMVNKYNELEKKSRKEIDNLERCQQKERQDHMKALEKEQKTYELNES